MDAIEARKTHHFDADVSISEARSELDRLLSDPEFRCSERNRRFLEFSADQLFRGHANSLKAYTIALDVFGRSSNFDPQTDPIVRIEASRLRSCLASYYEVHGYRAGVWISLPCGRYIPEFSRPHGRYEPRVTVTRSRRALATEPMIASPGLSTPILSHTIVDWRSAVAGVAIGLILGLFLAS